MDHCGSLFTTYVACCSAVAANNGRCSVTAHCVLLLLHVAACCCFAALLQLLQLSAREHMISAGPTNLLANLRCMISMLYACCMLTSTIPIPIQIEDSLKIEAYVEKITENDATFQLSP